MPAPDARREAGGRTQGTRAERRRAARIRRNRLVLVLAGVCSLGILGAWFPTSSLLHQRAQLAAAATQLAQLNRADAALAHREKQLRTPTTIGRIAQQQYDLVPPGEQAYQVLPPSGTGKVNGSLGRTAAAGLATGPGARGAGSMAGASGSASGSASGTASGSFFARILRTLEFWR
jgi:cell division protein FtsB